MKYHIFILLIICASATTNTREGPEYRLPEDAVKVLDYIISLKVSSNTFTDNTFEGATIISFTVLKNSTEIKLHANNLNFSLVQLSGQDLPFIEHNIDFDSVTDILTINASTELLQGTNYILTFTYTALLRTDEMYGFYKSFYYDEENNIRYLGTTQFQATSARKVFPCFDEPSYKAVFRISIEHPRELSVIGNTKGTVSPTSDNNVSLTSFEATPEMSTYLIAFIVSDFTCTDSTETLYGNLTHTVCSRRETVNEREAALSVGPKLVEVMEEFTNIKYSDSNIGKMHQVAIPDFSAGAMENWGLLTYRETGLLWDKDESSNMYLQRLENVVAHEITHMWFGNLVTCHWWSDTFLNEGFARFFQYFATHQVETSWQLDKQFVIEQLQPMLATDAQPSATALSHEVSSPAQVSGRFTSVSYSKGASVLRMIQHFMGSDNFKAGVQKYLSDNQFDAVKPEHLWSALQTTVGDALPSGSTLTQVVDTWITKPGFPLLSVTQTDRDLHITQKRFSISGNGSEKWYVPVTYTTSADRIKFEDTSTKAWLLPDVDLHITNVLSSSDDWVVLNNQQTGFYRVHYDDVLLSKIKNALNQGNFSNILDINRAQLVDDVYNLAVVGTYSYKDVLDFFRLLKNDTSYYPWYAAFNAFSSMLQRTANARIRASLSEYILDLMTTLLAAVPFTDPKDDEQIYTFNRVQALTWACRLGNQNCTKESIAAFEEYKATEQKPDKNLKTVIYCNGLKHSSNITSDWNFLWDEYTNAANLATEQATILSALGCTTDRTVLINYLQKSIDANSGIRQQDAASVFSTIYTQTPEGVAVALDFLLENYRNISAYYGTMNSLNTLFTGLAGRFTTQAEIDQLEYFLNTTSDLTESLTTSARDAVQNAKANLRFIEQFEKELTDYFNVQASSSAQSVTLSFITCIAASFVYYLYH